MGGSQQVYHLACPHFPVCPRRGGPDGAFRGGESVTVGRGGLDPRGRRQLLCSGQCDEAEADHIVFTPSRGANSTS